MFLHQGGPFRQQFPVQYLGTTIAGTAIDVDLVPDMVLARVPLSDQNTQNAVYSRPEASNVDAHLVKVVHVPSGSKRGGIVEVVDFDPEGTVFVLGDFSSVTQCIPVANQFYLAPAAAIDGTSISLAELATIRSVCGKYVDTGANVTTNAARKRVEFNGRR